MTSKIRALAVQETKTVIVTKGLSKIYPNGTQALRDVNFSVRVDDFIVSIGRSGAGKTTLLRCFNRLIHPTEGRIILKGEDITSVTGRRLQQVRGRMAMIFQQFNLVRRLTVIENVLVGRFHFQKSAVRWVGSLLRCFGREDKDIAFECLKEVGIGDLAFQRCERLSGGQQQRVAIARAHLPESLKTAFLGALLMFNKNKEGLNQLQIGGYQYVDDSSYDVIRYLKRLKKWLAQ